MLSEFLVYLRLGFEHISDLNGYDHILFIAALAAVYRLREWKEMLVLVTAFTVGHSVTLALATLDLIRFDEGLIELLIPITIVATGVLNIAEPPTRETRRARILKYALALGFGLIHGMGFSNFLRAVLGGEEGMLVPLLAFNVGLELGQILILFVILAIAYLVVERTRVQQRDWVMVLSGAAVGISLTMILERLAG